MELNIRKMANHPPSPVYKIIFYLCACTNNIFLLIWTCCAARSETSQLLLMLFRASRADSCLEWCLVSRMLYSASNTVLCLTSVSRLWRRAAGRYFMSSENVLRYARTVTYIEIQNIFADIGLYLLQNTFIYRYNNVILL